MAAPSAQEQYSLELLNETRLDPLGNAERYISSYATQSSPEAGIASALRGFGVDMSALQAQYEALTPVAVLAWSPELADAASGHNVVMMAQDIQTHQAPGEAGLGDRLKDAGYQFRAAGENVFAYSQSVLYGHAGFMIDWGYDDEDMTNGVVNKDYRETGDGIQDPAGHRRTIMSGGYSEVGIAIDRESDGRTAVGEYVITQDFGARGRTFVTGVAYNDADGNAFYSIGEGLGSLTVTVDGSGSVTSYESGGYSLQTGTGSKTITLTGAGLASAVTVVATVNANLKLDVVNGDTLLTSGSVSVTGPVDTIKGLGLVGLSLSGDDGDQTIIGTKGDDTLSGRAGDDRLEGGLGNDRLDGGAGNDIAVYSGRHSAYSITLNGGTMTLSGNGEGSDTLTGIESLLFSDGVFHWDKASATLVAGAAETIPETGGGSVDPDGGDPDGADPGKNGDPGSGSKDDTPLPIPEIPEVPGFTLRMDDGLAAIVGGSGDIFGTTGKQDVSLFDVTGSYVLDPSFNKGGDVIRLPGSSSTYAIRLEGSSVVLARANAEITIPVGPNSNLLGFSDGFLELGIDTAAGVVKLGSQTVTSQALQIEAAPVSNPDFGDPLDGSAQGTMTLEGNATVYTSGDFSIFGTSGGEEEIFHSYGDLVFDPSFNRGGDTLHVLGSVDDYAGYLNGSTLVMFSDDVEVRLPVGPAGMDIDFGGTMLTLRVEGGSVLLGDQAITATSDGTAVSLTGAGSPISGDVTLEGKGGDTNLAQIDLDPQSAVDITFDVSQDEAHVEITNFTADDRILVTNADRAEFSYGAVAADGDNVFDDIFITYNVGGKNSEILLHDVFDGDTLIFSEQTAEVAAGWNFISFG
jgi:uncharacterized protein YkwD